MNNGRTCAFSAPAVDPWTPCPAHPGENSWNRFTIISFGCLLEHWLYICRVLRETIFIVQILYYVLKTCICCLGIWWNLMMVNLFLKPGPFTCGTLCLVHPIQEIIWLVVYQFGHIFKASVAILRLPNRGDNIIFYVNIIINYSFLNQSNLFYQL